MKEIKRAVHFDFHTPAGIYDFNNNFDTEQFAEDMKNANVKYVNVFARCNKGFSYYPTKIGTPYPTMTTDLCGNMIKSLKKRNIGVTAYINGGLNHRLLIDNPGFMQIDKLGRAYADPDTNFGFFRVPCFNTGYRNYLISEVKEVLEILDPDGIFVDCMLVRSCYCPACTKKMKAQGIDRKDDDAVYAFAVDTMRETMAQISAVIPEGKRFIINGCPPYEDTHHLQSHVEIECLPTWATWGYDFIAAMAPYHRNFAKDHVYMTGSFVRGWGDFGSKKTIPALENDVYDALLYGFTPSIGDHIHPRDGINREFYKEIGKVYARVKELEKWNDDSIPVCDTAIIRNKIFYKNATDYLNISDKGAARILSELKICYDVINEDMDFDKYKLLVLPDKIKITDGLAKKLEGFKGAILSTGSSCVNGSIWDYFTPCEDNNTDGYYVYGGEVFNQYVPGIKMKSEYGISDYIEPYFRKEFDGLDTYYYNPPNKCDGYCAIAKKDNKIHICFNIFEAYMKHAAVFQKKLVESLINMLLPERIIDAKDLPSYSRATLMQGKEGHILHVKTTCPEFRGQVAIIEDLIPLVAGGKISVMGEYGNVYALPEMTPVESTIKDGRTHITLPQIDGYKSFLLTD